MNVCFASGNYGNWMRVREKSTQVAVINMSPCGQKWHDFIGIASWQDDWPLSINTLPLQVFTIVWDRNAFEGSKWLLLTTSCFAYKSLVKHSTASEWNGISYLVSKILCVFQHLAGKLNVRADAKHTINFKWPYAYLLIYHCDTCTHDTGFIPLPFSYSL